MKAASNSIFTLLIDNEFGVLTRITALIRRAGWNIRSLAVAETALTEVSRLTICLECRQHTQESVLDKLGRLACVREVLLFSQEDQVARELALVHLRPDSKVKAQAICEELGAQVLEEDGRFLLALVCEPGQLDLLMPRLRENGLVEITRTGAISLKRFATGEREVNCNEAN